MMRRSTISLMTAGACALAVPAAADAQAPPAAPKLSLTTEQVSSGGGRASVLTGKTWRVRVVMTPYVPGQVATVRFYRGGRRLSAVPVALAPSSTGRSGFALVPFTSGKAGRVEIRASHLATPQAPTLVAKPARVRVLAPSARPGSRGPLVRLLQGQLAARGYVVGRSGLYDARTARAVLAFRKVTGMSRTTTASGAVFERLAKGGGQFRVRFPSHGKHVEADLSRQVIALIRGSKVERIYPTSSGTPATPTIRGSFRVYRKSPGYNAKAMFFSSYFIRGYAIHGYASVPNYPASHGCLRVPIPDAISIFNWLQGGDRVDVYA
jgi:peptidoglycan hydrolase-like protein with peptidoglycan-binding domain